MAKRFFCTLLAIILLLTVLPSICVNAAAEFTGPIKQVSLGEYHSAAITADGSLWTWGYNTYGQLGDSTTTNRSTPVKVLDNVVAVSLGTSHSAAVKTDGSLWTWGSNGFGQLGDGTTLNHSRPEKVLDNVATVSLGDFHSAAIKTDGSLWTWGCNDDGELGDGKRILGRSTPVKILDNVSAVFLGGNHSAAIKTDGSLWTWGSNWFGQLGDGTIRTRTTPVKILDNVATVSLDYQNSAAVKTDGSLWTWGKNSNGQSGDGTTKERHTPVKILDNVASVSLGESYIAAIKTDGSLWTWGSNWVGQLGDGTTTSRSTPVNILDSVVAVSLGYGHSAAIKTDGSLWTWGKNSSGQLGDGTTTDRYMPVQIAEGGKANQGKGSVLDETILRAKELTNNYEFNFYRAWAGPVSVMAHNLDPTPSKTWYVLENYSEVLLNSLKSILNSSYSISEFTMAEFYEFLLLKMLDSREFQFAPLNNLLTPVNTITGEPIDTSLLEDLAEKGFDAGSKIKSKDLSDIQEICEAVVGSDDFIDVGWWDSFDFVGKTIDAFVEEFILRYQLSTISEAQATAILHLCSITADPALNRAARNVANSIQKAREEGIGYAIKGGIINSLESMATWFVDKTIDIMCEANPALNVWMNTATVTMATMDTLFLTDDISTDVICLLAMANIDDAIRQAINKAEKEFSKSETLENANALIALAELFQKEMIVGCDVTDSFFKHSERSKLNWNGILDGLSMVAEKKVDVPAVMRFLFGDPASSNAHIRQTVREIKQGIENANFYSTDDVMPVIQTVHSTTPSSWAIAEVNKAISYGILPEKMRNNYQTNITRLEFCLLLEHMIEKKTGKSIEALIEENGTQIQLPFDDAKYISVNHIAALGIIKGIGNNRFNPLGEITRQEAATMLYRTAKVLGYNTTSTRYSESGITEWAREGIDFVTTYGIMNGTGKGFSPLGKYTKEQSILTMVRFFEKVK